MDYWKEAEKIYTDLERKGYRMIFDNDNGDEYYRSCIDFTEKGAEREECLLSLSFGFPIEEVLRYADKVWELEDMFMDTSLFEYDKPKAKQLGDYMINEFEYHCTEINRSLRSINQCGNPIKMFHFYVTVAQKYYSNIISKAREIVIEEG